jgi:hypothetical protein
MEHTHTHTYIYIYIYIKIYILRWLALVKKILNSGIRYSWCSVLIFFLLRSQIVAVYKEQMPLSVTI